MAEDLARRQCEACTAGTPTFDQEQAERMLADIDDGWSTHGKTIERTYKFKNFQDPFALATKIALLAESQGHHPDLQISWGRLVVSLTTHIAGGLTENDFIMAAKIDRLT